MIEADKRKAVFLLHQEGMGRRTRSPPAPDQPQHGSRDHQTQGEMPAATRQDKIRWMRIC